METFDLGIALDSESDNEFVNDLHTCALKEGLKPYLIHAYNFFSSLKDITDGRLSFRYFFDHSSDESSTFGGLADFLKKKDIIFINHPDNVKDSQDKFKIHSMFISYGVPIPKTVFIKPQYVNDRPDMRKKSKFNIGLPDEIVNKVIRMSYLL